MNELTIGAIVFAGTAVFVFGVAYFVFNLLHSENVVVGKRFHSVHRQMQSSLSQDQQLALLKKENDWKKYEFFSDFPPFLNLPLLFEQAGLNQDVSRWMMATAGVAIFLASMSLYISANILLGFAVFAGSVFVSYLRILWKRKRRLRAFEANLAQCLEIIGRSLRAGHPFSMGLQMTATEMPAPISTEFSRIYRELQMGLPLEESLRKMAARVPLLDIRFFVLSILIHDQIGGDLAEILDNLSRVIRDRFKVLGQVRALTAEGRMSGWVLSLLPVFVFLVILCLNPKYILLLLNTEIGNKMLTSAVVMQFFGILIIRKIVNIKV
ncbi:MAG: type II secretion system F family protein [Candidatus Omnitrophota bacterium]